MKSIQLIKCLLILLVRNELAIMEMLQKLFHLHNKTTKNKAVPINGEGVPPH